MVMRNLYGCAPCPDCGSKYRWPTQSVHPEHPSSIICDDCGRVRPYVHCSDIDGDFYNEAESSVASTLAHGGEGHGD